MADLGDHAAYRRGVFKNPRAMTLVEAETDQRQALVVLAADWAADLRDRDCLALFCVTHRPTPCLRRQPYSRAAAAASASRRPRMSPIFLPRRAATARGLLMLLRAAKVALIMLCGFDEPIDFA